MVLETRMKLWTRKPDILKKKFFLKDREDGLK